MEGKGDRERCNAISWSPIKKPLMEGKGDRERCNAISPSPIKKPLMEGKGAEKDVTQFHGVLKPQGLRKRNGSPQKGYSDRRRD